MKKNVFELKATKQNSYYNKALVIVTDLGVFLQSYNTIVCGVIPNNETGELNDFRRFWKGYSRTTAKHVDEFLNLFGMRGLCKADWLKLECYNLDKFTNNECICSYHDWTERSWRNDYINNFTRVKTNGFYEV